MCNFMSKLLQVGKNMVDFDFNIDFEHLPK